MSFWKGFIFKKVWVGNPPGLPFAFIIWVINKGWMPFPLILWIVYLWWFPWTTAWSTLTYGIRNERSLPVPVHIRIPIKTKNRVSRLAGIITAICNSQFITFTHTTHILFHISDIRLQKCSSWFTFYHKNQYWLNI